jgi:PelA/Pel-15E family pectate lyase
MRQKCRGGSWVLVAAALAGTLPFAALTRAAAPAPAAAPQAAKPVDRAQVLAAMKRATSFMTDKVSVKGGYVWSYLPDLSRRWGEMEAFPTMIWFQAPGTPAVGQLFLDAYHVTHDEFYYDAAMKTAGACILAQRPSGGWNYIYDTAGEESLKKWYATIGKNGWRLEEFQHYADNGTYDDDTTTDATRFMLRLYLEKKDPTVKASLDKAIGFILDSQYKNGGWPQRFPKTPPENAYSKDGFPDYTGFITFNDNVVSDNVDILIEVYNKLGDTRVLDAIHRGMDIYILTQGKGSQPAWGLQHDPVTLEPASARTYEPKAFVTHTTAGNIGQLMRFYRLTGDKKYLAPIPAALDWLDSVKLPPNTPGARGTHPTFLEVGTNKPLYVHRRGSNAINGHYYVDQNPEHTIGHYNSFRSPNTDGLRQQYMDLLALPPEEVTRGSPLKPGAAPEPYPAIMSGRGGGGGGRGGAFGRGRGGPAGPGDRAAQLVASLNEQGYWPATLRNSSNPYKGDGPAEVAPGDFGSTDVGDSFDTSPSGRLSAGQGFTTSGYIANMSTLLRYLEAQQ